MGVQRMKTVKRIFQGCIGLLLSAGFALAASAWIFPKEQDELFSIASFRLGISGAGTGLAVLVLLLFSDGWIGQRKRWGKAVFPVSLFQGIGYGLLPAIAVFKAFAHFTSSGIGKPVPEGIGQFPWLTAEGNYLPCRLEMILALICFGAMTLWLILRREELPENGDLLFVSLTLWAACRLVTETFRGPEGIRIPVCIAAAVLLICLLVWTGRAFRHKQNTGYAGICIPVFLVFTAGIFLQDAGILSVNTRADLAIRIVCVLLVMKAVLCMGRVSR